MQMFRGPLTALPAAALALGFCFTPAAADTSKDVLKNYADIAQAGYEDSLDTAKTLKLAIDAFIAEPTEANLRGARAAWIAARIPYMQTEAYRFGNAIVDDWEGRVNSWPLDEGLIDYVAAAYGDESPENELYVANVIKNVSLTIGGKTLNTAKLTKELLADDLQEAGGVEANVATGYHAVEFLLWGQDVNGTGPGAGARPATDFDPKNCTNGNCARRAEYLSTVTDLLIDDLAWMADQWAEGGEARKVIADGSDEEGLTALMTGLGSLSYGELAGERIKLGLMIHDPEEEHDCFSDNTHASHFFDALGIRNVYLGRYRRADGTIVGGASVSDLVKAKAPEVDAEMRQKLDATMDAMNTLYLRALTTESYDQMIGEDNDEGNKVVQDVVDALLAQTKAIERAVAALDLKSIEFEGSDSLDSPEKVAGE
ncbi:peptidase [Methyloceanibacter superfactus]|jgi:putative iron-regulated protein|uniref:Peptidase n=1 Tax=Methyloceanibacter superfactus TaxID=1774969 RepID=A0A1E3W772_9HYPH|nr:imelysin family protein [Methyloceanibacter superfactus]ODS01685.1 peptidase [Methyloceanibacter superfactus]